MDDYGDDYGGRVGYALTVIRSRRRRRPPKGQQNGGERQICRNSLITRKLQRREFKILDRTSIFYRIYCDSDSGE